MNLKSLIDINEYMKEITLSPLQKYVIPKSDSPLMIKHGFNFLDKVENAQVHLVTHDAIKASNIEFVPINMNDKAVFAAIGIAAIAFKHIESLMDLKKLVGFDIDALPEQEYMLKILYAIDPNHEIIKLLPKKGANELSNLQKNALIKSLTVLKETKKIDSLEVPNTISNKYKQTAIGYVFVTQKIKDTKLQLSELEDMAKSNQSLALLLDQSKKNLQIKPAPKPLNR